MTDNKILLEEKTKELNKLEKEIVYYKPQSFFRTILKPSLLAFVGLIIGYLAGLSNFKLLAVFMGVFFLGLLIFVMVDKKNIENQKKDMVARRLKLQKEIVRLRKEVRNENNQIQ